MSTLKDDMLLGVRRYHKKINDLILPLDQYFGINNLTYIEVTNNNRLINLCSNRDWLEHCVANELYADDPQMVTPDNIGHGYAMWSCDWESHYKDEAYENGLMQETRKFDMYKGITYIQKNKNGYRVYILCSSEKNHALHTNLYSNMTLVKKFINYFDQELNPMRKELSDNMIDLAKLRGPSYFSQPGLIAPQKLDKQKQYKFLQQIGLLDNSLDKVNLTTREIQCINLYLEGNSAQSTADKLSISRRTVESHMDSIKVKLKLDLKRDLFDKFKVLKELEII